MFSDRHAAITTIAIICMIVTLVVMLLLEFPAGAVLLSMFAILIVAYFVGIVTWALCKFTLWVKEKR